MFCHSGGRDAFLPSHFFSEHLFCASCGASIVPVFSMSALLLVGAAGHGGCFLGRFGLPHNPAAGLPYGPETSEAGVPMGGPTSPRHGDGSDYLLSRRIFYSSCGTFPCKLKCGNHSPNRQAQGRIKKYPPRDHLMVPALVSVWIRPNPSRGKGTLLRTLIDFCVHSASFDSLRKSGVQCKVAFRVIGARLYNAVLIKRSFLLVLTF